MTVYSFHHVPKPIFYPFVVVRILESPVGFYPLGLDVRQVDIALFRQQHVPVLIDLHYRKIVVPTF
jgi:hypothetical protein